VLIVMMFAGRLGPLTLAVALTHQDPEDRVQYPRGMVRIG
jgi:trk system potassium uptake protein TrkH